MKSNQEKWMCKTTVQNNIRDSSFEMRWDWLLIWNGVGMRSKGGERETLYLFLIFNCINALILIGWC